MTHMSQLVRSDRPAEHVTVITLHDPPMNFGSLRLIAQLHGALDDAAAAGVRVVVLASDVPDVFMTHAFLPDVVAAHDGVATEDPRHWFRALRLLEQGPFLTIAANNGRAWGAGAELCWASHLRVAGQSATFGQPEVRLGVVPGLGGISQLARLAGQSICMRMILDGSPVSALDCERWGLVHRVVPDDQVLPATLAWAVTLAKRPPDAVRACIAALIEGRDVPLHAALRGDAQHLAQLVASDASRTTMREAQARYDQGEPPEMVLGMRP